MEYPAYAAFTKRFGEEPSAYLEKLSSAQLLRIARELEIAFVPPFGEDDPQDVVRTSIIQVAVADFQEPDQECDLIRAVEKCSGLGT